MAKEIDVQKEPVKLREKVLKNGSISLFLDVYSNGRRHKEYLKLYLIDNFLCTTEYDYSSFHLTMHCYLCSVKSGEIELREHKFAR